VIVLTIPALCCM